MAHNIRVKFSRTGEEIAVIRRGKVWLRLVPWDELPHLLPEMPKDPDDVSCKWVRVQWETFRQLMIHRPSKYLDYAAIVELNQEIKKERA